MFTIKKDYNLTLYIISQYLNHKIAEKFVRDVRMNVLFVNSEYDIDEV